MQTKAIAISMISRRSELLFSRPSTLEKFRHFIESADWDEDLIHYQKWIDRACLGFVIFSVLYFVPVLIFTLLK